MRDGTHGKDGWARVLLLVIRFLCSRRGAAAGRAAMLVCSFVLAGLIALVVWKGPYVIDLVWDRFVAMETNIAKIQSDLHDYQLGANYRTLARDRQVTEIETDVDHLQSDVVGIDRRVIRLEARVR